MSERQAPPADLRKLSCWNALRLEVDSGIVDDVIERVSAVFAERERLLRERIEALRKRDDEFIEQTGTCLSAKWALDELLAEIDRHA